MEELPCVPVFVISVICASMKCMCTWHEMFHGV